MVVGIGCDVVEHRTLEKLGWSKSTEVLARIFSQIEIGIYNKSQKLEVLAGRFAIKEAVLKCLGTGMQDGISLTDIQTLQGEAGKPILEVKGVVKRIADTLFIDSWHVSITHSEEYSLAFVIAESFKT